MNDGKGTEGKDTKAPEVKETKAPETKDTKDSGSELEALKAEIAKSKADLAALLKAHDELKKFKDDTEAKTLTETEKATKALEKATREAADWQAKHSTAMAALAKSEAASILSSKEAISPEIVGLLPASALACSEDGKLTSDAKKAIEKYVTEHPEFFGKKVDPSKKAGLPPGGGNPGGNGGSGHWAQLRAAGRK